VLTGSQAIKIGFGLPEQRHLCMTRLVPRRNVVTVSYAGAAASSKPRRFPKVAQHRGATLKMFKTAKWNATAMGALRSDGCDISHGMIVLYSLSEARCRKAFKWSWRGHGTSRQLPRMPDANPNKLALSRIKRLLSKCNG
jgi:hypothetical protein